jgi:hypothetical protein
MVCWWVLVYSGRKEPPLLCVSLSRSLQRKYRGEGGRATCLFWSFPHSRQQLSFPGQCTALQIIDHLPALGAGFSLFDSPNTQAKSFGVSCLDVGVCFVECVFSGITHAIDF